MAAVFLIVVLAALGTFAARVALTQQETVNLALLESQGLAAANSGLELGANQTLRMNQCPASTAFSPAGAGLTGFSVVVTCSAVIHANGKTSYALVSTAARGTYGQPDFVSRQVTRTLTTP